MKSKLSPLMLVVVVVFAAAVPSAAAPLSSPCAPGAAYNPACDVDQNGTINIADIQLTAGHWNQTGAFTSDNNHDHLGQTWTGSNNPLKIQGAFGSPDYAPLVLTNTSTGTGAGLRVNTANGTGIWVESAGGDGVIVSSVNGAGLAIGSAGDQGVRIDSATMEGVWVYAADTDGLSVCRAGAVSGCTLDYGNANGLEIGNAEDYGARVLQAGRAAFRSEESGTNAFYAYDAGDSGVWIRAATNWAGYFTGDINVTGACTGCLIAQLAVNSGNETLQPGDVVTIAGIDASPFDGMDMLMRVRRAFPGSPLVGVVSGRAEPFTSQEDGTHTLVPRLGELAAPGEYLSVVIYGPVQVKAASHVRPGDRVTPDETGSLRAIRRVTVEGVILDEGGSSLGMALDAAKDGLVWVLVNPQ